MPEPATETSRRTIERGKWDAYFQALPAPEEDELTRRLNAEFVEAVSNLLPPGSRTLEAGCGAGWQSLALARTGRFQTSLLDFSPRALEYSKRVFEGEKPAAEFLLGDIFAPGEPAYDLVFNAGVLEQYDFEEQAALLGAMAARSRRYVMALVPNPQCYWDGMGRAAAGAPCDRENPPADLSAVFEAAGLHFCGQNYLGAAGPEALLDGLPEASPEFRRKMTEWHRQAPMPAAQSGAYIAALGSVSAGEAPPGWTTGAVAGTGAGAQALRRERLRLEAALAAQRHAADTAFRTEQERFEFLRRGVSRGVKEFQAQFEKHLSSYREQRAWGVMLAIRKAYTLLAVRKWRGILPFLGWTLGSLVGRSEDLQEYELKFPHLLNYLPEDLHTPICDTAEPEEFAPKGDRKFDVVILPIFDFEFRYQRPQQIAAQFARAGHRVFWVSPSRLLPDSAPSSYEQVRLQDNVWEIRVRRTAFDLYRGALDALQKEDLLDGLRRLYHDLGITSSVAVVQFPFWRQIALGLRESLGAKVIYDCMDDWQNWPVEPLPGAYSLAEERKLVAEADVLVVTSRELHDRHAASGVSSELIPNAADFDFFREAQAGPALDTRPVVGYYGAIADWFDLELMTEVARLRPQYAFVFIGQVHMLDVSALKALPNTQLLGERHYRELPAYLARFDVCTLPFRMNRLTKAVDPVKVYEYLSQGKPVVSAPLPELAPLEGLLYFANGAAEFAAGIDRAIAERDTALVEKRVAFAAENTWAARVDALQRAIRPRYPLVSILVVTYNSHEYLEPFFDSIRRNTSYPNYEVIVVDNHSRDRSAEYLAGRAALDPRIRIEFSRQNLGFPGGNNAAGRLAAGEYVVLLNPDTVVTAGWLERLLRPLERDSTVGMTAPVTNFSGNETKINTHYRSLRQMERFAGGLARAKSGESMEIEAIPLLCGALRRTLWEELDGLDEGFEIGTFEDDDFSLRIRNAGYRLLTAEDCFIHHFGNGAFSKLKFEESARIFEQNRKRFESKWNVAWRPHVNRPGVRPISEDIRVSLEDFLEGDGAGGR